MQRRDNVLVLTGGHAAAVAEAVVSEINRRKKDWKIHWIGAKYAMEGKAIPTFEYKVLPSLGVTFHSLFTGRIQKRFTFWTIPSLLKIPIGFVHAFGLLTHIKPKLVVSFGGFASFPIVVCAWLLGIPVIMHEQTIVAGQANIFSQYFVKKILLSRIESTTYLDGGKSVLVGNPISRQIELEKPKLAKTNPPVLFVTGGSRGSSTINTAIEAILPMLLTNYKVIHQTGDFEYPKFEGIKKNLPTPYQKNYTVYGTTGVEEWSGQLNSSDIVVARAGAHTVSVLLTSKKPSILIPLRYAYKDEQMKNALFAKEFGVSEIISETELTPELLLMRIEYLNSNWEEIVKAVREKVSPDVGATARVTDTIEEEMN